MRETCRVMKIENDGVLVLVETDSQKPSCNNSAFDKTEGCHNCSLFKPKFRFSLKAKNIYNLALEPNDLVEIEFKPTQTVLSAFLFFILPLFMFAFFYLSFSLLLPSLEEVFKVGLSFFGLLACWFFTFFWQKKQKVKNLPIVSQILAKASSFSACSKS